MHDDNYVNFPTDSTKINRPGYNIRMYWTNFRQPTVHVQQFFYEKTLIEVGSSHLLLAPFVSEPDQFLEAQWVFENVWKR